MSIILLIEGSFGYIKFTVESSNKKFTVNGDQDMHCIRAVHWRDNSIVDYDRTFLEW